MSTVEGENNINGGELGNNLQSLVDNENLSDNPQDWKFVVVNHHEQPGIKRINTLIEEGRVDPNRVSERPYNHASKDVLELAESLGSVSADENVLVEAIVEKIQNNTQDLSLDEIRGVVETGSIIKDLAFLARETEEIVSNPELIEAHSRWIWDPIERTLDKYIGHKEHRLLLMSRLVGLIPFKEIEKLRSTKIRVAGASVAASEIDLLACLGAEDIRFYDKGELDASKIFIMPGGMGDFRNIGIPKATALMRTLYGRNPYGSYEGVPGNILFPGEVKINEHDTPISEAMGDADLAIEVIDNPFGKIAFRNWMQQEKPDTPSLWLADVGSNPFVGIENPASGNWFNQSISDDEKERMLITPTSVGEAKIEGARSVYLMVDKGLPDDHRLQFLLWRLGVIPYWSQTPISSRESASIASKLILMCRENSEVVGKNISLDESPVTLTGEFNDGKSRLLSKICKQIFDIK